MNFGTTGRGFAVLRFTDRYGAACSLQKSSLATEDAVWFGPDDAAPKVLASEAAALGVQTTERTGWVPFPVPDAVQMTTRMHLTREQVTALLPYLQRFAETGELRPNAALTGGEAVPVESTVMQRTIGESDGT